MKKLITTILALAMLASFIVLPNTASAESTTIFKYENDFSGIDAPGTASTGAWDMENVGKWVTVKTSETNDVDQWERKDIKGVDGKSGVLSLGDSARPAFLFDTPIKDGKVHISYYVKFKSQTKANPYYYSGLAGAKYKDDDFTVTDDMVILSSHSDSNFVDILQSQNMHTDKLSVAAGVIGSPYASGPINLDFGTWYKLDVLMEIKSDETMEAKYYIDGVQKWTNTATTAQSPFYAMMFQTNINFDDGEVLIDNVLIEHYTGEKTVTGTKTFTAVADKEALAEGENSVTFTFSEAVDTSLLTSENIKVIKNYEAYADYTITDVTATTVTVGGLDADGMYSIFLPDSVEIPVFGQLTDRVFTVVKGGNLSDFIGFKYENDFSTADAPGAASTGSWDMEGIGKWATFKTSATNDVDQWSHDTKALSPSGTADGVLRLGDDARPTFYFDAPLIAGNVHVGFDFYYEALEDTTRSDFMYSYFGFLHSYAGTYNNTADSVVAQKGSNFDNNLVKAFMTSTGKAGANQKYAVGGLADGNYGGTNTTFDYNKWMRVDLVLENIESSENMVAKWYIDGVLKYTAPASWKKVLQPLYGFVLQTNGNFNNECALIDNLVIENYTGTKTFTAKADKKELKADENSVTFTFSDLGSTSVLTKDDITVTKDYESYEAFTVTQNTAKTLTISGLDDEGVYNVKFADGALQSPEQKNYIITKGKISNFVYKQDFANSDVATWNDENIGKWYNNTTVSFAHDAEYTGADGKAGVMKLASGARPAFVFDKAITDGTIHLSYKAKFDKSTANFAYYYSGLANEVIMNGATIDGNNITMNYSYANLLDTFMGGNMQTDSDAFLCPGVIGNGNPDKGNGIEISYDDWNRVDVIITINSKDSYFAAYYINGKLKLANNYTTLVDPFYAFVMYPFNMGTGNTYIDDLVIEHSYNTAVISDVDLSVAGKVKVTIPDTSVNTTSVRKVMVAGYKEKALVNVGFADFTLGRTKTSVDVDFDTTGCDEIKVFLMDSLLNLTPIANTYTQNLNN